MRYAGKSVIMFAWAIFVRWGSPAEVISSMGHGLGFCYANARKSSPTVLGKTTKFAWL